MAAFGQSRPPCQAYLGIWSVETNRPSRQCPCAALADERCHRALARRAARLASRTPTEDVLGISIYSGDDVEDYLVRHPVDLEWRLNGYSAGADLFTLRCDVGKEDGSAAEKRRHLVCRHLLYFFQRTPFLGSHGRLVLDREEAVRVIRAVAPNLVLPDRWRSVVLRDRAGADVCAIILKEWKLFVEAV